jgi:hypothetical protein
MTPARLGSLASGGPAALFTLLAAGPAFAQGSTATVELRASLIKGLTVSSEGPLSFGGIVPSPSSVATITVAPSGTVSSSLPIQAPSLRPAAPAPFRVLGQANAFYQVALPASGVISTTGATMRLSDFTLAFPGGGPGQLDASGAQTFAVGATLTVGADQAAGDYVGVYTVTVRYQ